MFFVVFSCWAQRFEVASVKACDPHTVPGTNAGGGSPGRVDFTCQSLMTYIRQAYGVWGNGSDRPAEGPFNIVGGPAWMESNRDLYKITATYESSVRPGASQGPMMQALLEDRFKLKIHRETREVPVYALVASKSGVKLPAAKTECWSLYLGRRPAPPKDGQPVAVCGHGQMTKDGVEVHGSSMADFCVALAHVPLRIVDRRKFVDRTGVAGRFDFDLKFPDPAGDQFDDLVRLQEALARFGLQLKSEKGQDEFIVIDHVERPTAN